MPSSPRRPGSPSAIARVAAAAAALAALSVLAPPALAGYSLIEIANTGSGAFNGGQLFGTPILQSSTGAVYFAGQDASRFSGIFTGTSFGTTLLNADAIGTASQRVLEVNRNGNALAVDASGGLYETSLATTGQPRTALPAFVNLGADASIDDADNVYYVAAPEGGGNPPSILGVPSGGSSVRILDGRPTPQTVFYFPTYGFDDPKVAERGSQTFGPSLVHGMEFLAFIIGISSIETIDAPFAQTGGATVDAVGINNGNVPAYRYLTDVNGSGQIVFRVFDDVNNVIQVKAAQAWNVPVQGGIPTRTLFQFVGANPSTNVAAGIAIAKGNTHYAVSLDNSITASWVGAPSKSLVVNLGQMLGSRMVVGIEVSERGFVDDFGEVVFKARLADGTTSILLGVPGLGFLPSASEIFRTAAQDCFACQFTLAASDPDHGTQSPIYTRLTGRPDTVKFTAPPGLQFTHLVLPQTTTEDHPDVPAHAHVHFVFGFDGGPIERDVDVDANTDLDFGQFAVVPVTEFFLDGFSGFPDEGLQIGLTFDQSPDGQVLGVVAGASRQVSIAIPPTRSPKRIAHQSRGKLTVGVLSAADFDATALVDPSSLTFGHTGDEASLVSCSTRPRDLNHDGLPDLVCKFSTRAAAFQVGDHLGVLKGRLFDGTRAGGAAPVLVH